MPDFAAFFHADMPAEDVPFTVNGQPCEFQLRVMDQGARTRYEAMILCLPAKLEKGGEEAANAILAAQQYLVCETVTGWCIRYLKPVVGSPGETVQEENRAPAGKEDRIRTLKGWKTNPDVWEWLVNACLQKNGLTEPEAGN